jgi:hypothetical protein
MRILLAIIASLAFSFTAAFAADPVGTYRVEGSNPGGGSSYSGTVTVERTGDTYRVIWVIGNDRFVGTGIGNRENLSVSYRSSNLNGLAVYTEDGGNWTGVWAITDGRQIGREVWKRR